MPVLPGSWTLQSAALHLASFLPLLAVATWAISDGNGGNGAGNEKAEADQEESEEWTSEEGLAQTEEAAKRAARTLVRTAGPARTCSRRER